jgi:hypothetical protein
VGLYILAPIILLASSTWNELVIHSFRLLLARIFMFFQNVLILTSNAANPHTSVLGESRDTFSDSANLNHTNRRRGFVYLTRKTRPSPSNQPPHNQQQSMLRPLSDTSYRLNSCIINQSITFDDNPPKQSGKRVAFTKEGILPQNKELTKQWRKRDNKPSGNGKGWKGRLLSPRNLI